MDRHPVRLNAIESNEKNLYLDPNVNDPEEVVVTIVYFQMPAAGYPIKVGSYRKAGDIFTSNGEIEDKEGLLSFFEDLLEQPESTLIQALGFALRQRKE